MTVKQHTPSGAQHSTSARTTNRPAEPARPKHTAASDKKGKVEGSKSKLTTERTAQIEAEAEAFKQKAHDYASKAYTAALAHYEANHSDTFALSRLAVVYGEQRPGDVHMVVTLPGVTKSKGVQESHVRELIKAAERIARTLEDPECSEAYRKAFGSIYTTHLLEISGTDWEHPTVVRVLLPLVMLDLWDNRPADADTALEILSITLRDALNPDEVCERTRACA